MDGAGAEVQSLPRFRDKGGYLYHVYRGTWRRVGGTDDVDAALRRYRELEGIIGDIENRLDAAAGAWDIPDRRDRSGPRIERAYPPRMHAKTGRLYHVFRNKWRPLGRVEDYAAAVQRYWEIEREVVAPAKRERHGRRERTAGAATRPVRRQPEPPEPPRAPAAAPVQAPARARPWRGYYGGGTPVPGAR